MIVCITNDLLFLCVNVTGLCVCMGDACMCMAGLYTFIPDSTVHKSGINKDHYNLCICMNLWIVSGLWIVYRIHVSGEMCEGCPSILGCTLVDIYVKLYILSWLSNCLQTVYNTCLK